MGEVSKIMDETSSRQLYLHVQHALNSHVCAPAELLVDLGLLTNMLGKDVVLLIKDLLGPRDSSNDPREVGTLSEVTFRDAGRLLFGHGSEVKRVRDFKDFELVAGDSGFDGASSSKDHGQTLTLGGTSAKLE